METIAVYWESQIKTYGFNRRGGLCLASMDLSPDLRHPSDPISSAETALPAALEPYCREILMVSTCPQANGRLRLHLLFEPAQGRTPEAIGRSLTEENGRAAAVDLHMPVDAVIFQGPHFGDRYGIADAALRSLDSAGVPVMSMTCGGSSICLVLPGGSADDACKALETAFVVPSAPKRRKRS